MLRKVSQSVRNVKVLPMVINGEQVHSKTKDFIEVHNPATNEVIAAVPKCTQSEMQAAVDDASKAFKSWSQTSIMTRQQIMIKYGNLIRDNVKDLAAIITEEQGKTLADAEGDVGRGLQVVEHACAAPELLLGESAHNLSKDLDTITHKYPLGVCAGMEKCKKGDSLSNTWQF